MTVDWNGMQEKVVVGVISAIVLGGLTLLWNLVSNGGIVRAMGGVTQSELQIALRGIGPSVPVSAIVAFARERCPDKWREVTELKGRFIIGGGQPGLVNGQQGGSNSFNLEPENLPPHRHQVYAHAGEMVGRTSGIQGSGNADPNSVSHVRVGAPNSDGVNVGLSGEGIGLKDERLTSAPVKFLPPYVPYTFCRPDETQ
jgi:hypothetical protein